MIVLVDYGQSMLVKNFVGVVQLVHKSNCRLAPEREVENFGRLPARTKAVLGAPFSKEDIQQAVAQGVTPEF